MRPVGLECYASEVTCRCRRTETRFVTRSTPEPRRQDRRRTGRGSDNDFRPESRGSSTQGPGKGVSDPDDCVEGTRLPAATSPSCVVMYEIEGLSVASIASLLGITAINQPIPGLLVAQVADSGRMIYLHPEIVVSNDDIAQSWVLQDGPARLESPCSSCRSVRSGCGRQRRPTSVGRWPFWSMAASSLRRSSGLRSAIRL